MSQSNLTPTAAIAMKALMLGIPIQLGERTVRYFRENEELGDSGYVASRSGLFIEMQRREGRGSFKTVYGVWDLSMMDFMELCDSMSEESRVAMVGSIALTQNKMMASRGREPLADMAPG